MFNVKADGGQNYHWGLKVSININFSDTGLDTLSLYNVFICKKRNSGFSWLKMNEKSIQLLDIPECFAAQSTWLPASSIPRSMLCSMGQGCRVHT
jgi:hypothetical protein